MGLEITIILLREAGLLYVGVGYALFPANAPETVNEPDAPPDGSLPLVEALAYDQIEQL